MASEWTRKRKTGVATLVVGLILMLMCHVAGSWELFRFGGHRGSLRSESLGYDLAFYDARPCKPEIGRAVIYEGFSSSTQVYFPLALTLLRSGYTVRLVSHSGSPNSPVEMSYKSHPVESTEVTQDFISDNPSLPLFLIGHSEGTRYALQTGNEISAVDGVIVMSPVSAALDSQRPANVLILVAENDFDSIKRQAYVLLMSGAGMLNPEVGELYGDLSAGTARMAEILPESNHFNIFLKAGSQRKILNWINQISGNPETQVRVSSAMKFPILALCALLGAAVAVTGIGLVFPRIPASASEIPPNPPLQRVENKKPLQKEENEEPSQKKENEKPLQKGGNNKTIPAWALLMLTAIGWVLAALLANYITFAEKIPLLVYARVLVFFAIAAVPLLITAVVRPSLGAGIPRGSWKARATLMGLTATLLLFDHWLVGVTPAGQRLLWFLFAGLITGEYFALDEFLRRSAQRATDWQTGFALGLATSFIAALSVAGAAFFMSPPIGEFLTAGAVTLFVLMAACEIPATYLFATTGDWFLSWWVRVTIFNGFLAGLVPLVTEAGFREMLH